MIETEKWFSLNRIESFVQHGKLDLSDEKKDVIEGLFPCGLTMVFGDFKSGKSLLAKHVATSVANPSIDKWMNLTINRHGKVIYFALDDNLVTLHERFDSKRDLKNLYIVPRKDYQRIVNSPEYSTRTHIGKFVQLIDDFIKSEGEVAMVVIDTYEKIRNPQGERNYAAEVEELNILKDHAAKVGYSAVLVHHSTKYKNTNSFQDFYGSNGIGAELDVLMRLSFSTDSEYQLVDAIGNNTERKTFYVTRDENLNYRLADIEDSDLVEDYPDKAYLMIVKHFTAKAMIEENHKFFEWMGEYQELITLLDLPTDSQGLGRILRKYRVKLEEQHIFVDYPRTKTKRFLKIRIDMRGGDGDSKMQEG